MTQIILLSTLDSAIVSLATRSLPDFVRVEVRHRLPARDAPGSTDPGVRRFWTQNDRGPPSSTCGLRVRSHDRDGEKLNGPERPENRSSGIRTLLIIVFVADRSADVTRTATPNASDRSDPSEGRHRYSTWDSVRLARPPPAEGDQRKVHSPVENDDLCAYLEGPPDAPQPPCGGPVHSRPVGTRVIPGACHKRSALHSIRSGSSISDLAAIGSLCPGSTSSSEAARTNRLPGQAGDGFPGFG